MRILPFFANDKKSHQASEKSFGQQDFTSSVEKSDKCELPYNMPRTEGKIGNVTISVAGGDMTQVKADAYLVPEFTSCISEGGIGGAIYRSGGGKGMEAYGKHIAESGKLSLKDVYIAKAGGGNSKYLIHAATVGADRDAAFEVAKDSVVNALKAAQEKGIKSVVIPAIGTGIIGSLTNTESANAILSGVKQFADEGGSMDVCAVVYSTGAGYNDFANALKNGSYLTAEATPGTKQMDGAAFAREMIQTISASPRAQYSDTPQFKEETVEKLLELRGKNGKKLLSKRDLSDLLESCQHSFCGGKPISRYEEKILAVINNPEELSSIADCSSPAYGIWRAIQDPLRSTRNANPELFNGN